MASKTSVVTPERFATGMATFKEWMEAIPERADEFQGHYDDYVPDPDDIAAIKKMVDERSVKALVLGEHWCPDVWRGLPVISHVSEQTGMELRMFFRDQNNDIMAEFLNQGSSSRSRRSSSTTGTSTTSATGSSARSSPRTRCARSAAASCPTARHPRTARSAPR